MLEKKVLDYITAHEEEARQLLLTMAQIPAPSNHEEERMKFCESWLKAMGAEEVYTDPALNVVYPYCVEDGKPVTVFMAHMDVVFPDRGPLPLKLDGDKICCPGVGDDTANLAALMMAAKYLTETGIRPREGGILFVCNSGEEGMGNLNGSRRICQDYKGRIQAFISLDGTLSGVVNRAVGSARYQVTVRTKGGHSYGCFGRANAIAKLAEVIHDLYQIQVPPEGKTTYNVGVIEGGTSVNSIAQTASMLCEYRSDREEGLAFMEKAFSQIFEAHRGEDVEIQVETVGLRPCESLDENQRRAREAMVQAASERIFQATGKEPKAGPSSTDCNIPLSQGIPSTCYGTYYGDGAHTREEYVLQSSLRAGYQVAFASVLSYC